MKAVALFAASMLTSSWAWAGELEFTDGIRGRSIPMEFALSPAGTGWTLMVGKIGFPSPESDSFTPSGRSANFDDALSGGRLSLSHAWQIRGPWDRPLFLALNTGVSLAQSEEKVLNSVSGGVSSVLVTSSADPVGRIDLETASSLGSSSASGTVRLGEAGPQISSAAISTGGSPGGISQFAVSSVDGGMAFLALTTEGQSGAAAAYGALVDDRGFTVLGTGDTRGTNITTRQSARFRAFEQDAIFATSVSLEGDWRMTAGVGPMFSHTKYEARRSISIDIDEGAADREVPNLALLHHDRIDTRYAGLTGAASVSRSISRNWAMRLGGGLGVSRYWSEYGGSSKALVEGFGLTDLEAQNDTLSGISFNTQASLDFTRSLSKGASFSLGVSAQYSGAVPTLENRLSHGRRDNLASSGTRSRYDARGERNFTPELTTRDSWTYGVQLGLTQVF